MIGTTLAHYRITAALGAGGMGEVWRAHDEKLGREVALKVLPEEFSDDPQRLERFEREARAVAALNHPHIVTIHSVEEVGGVHFLTMELVDGRSLDKLIPEGGFDLERFFELATPLAEAISAAHDKSVIHRDLKPANVMVDDGGRVKVLDFGLAKLQDKGDVSDSSELPTEALTGIGTIVGTVPYMSPEQVEGLVVDHRTDIFSLGVLLYEMALGERPFKGSTSPALMSSILRDVPQSVVEIRDDLPRHLARIIGRCLEKDRRDRYQTARDVFNELKALKRETSGALPSSARPRVEPSQDRSSASASVRARPGLDRAIAVVPFRAPPSDPALTTLAEGLAEDITTGLARFPYLTIMDGTGLDSGDGSGAPVRGRGVRYLLRGGLRSAGPELRLTVQLVEVESGAHVWSEAYDRRLEGASLFELQDDLTDRVVATVGDYSGVMARLVAAELRALPDEALTVDDWIMRSVCFVQVIHPPEEHAAIRDGLEAMVELHPDNAEAHAWLANAYTNEFAFGFNALEDPIGRTLQAAQRAVDLDPTSQAGWLNLAGGHFFLGDLAAFEAAAARAMALNPRNSYAIAYMGLCLGNSGQRERGAELGTRACALNPHHPEWYPFVIFYLHYAREEYEDACLVVKGINWPKFPYTHINFAAACGQLGRPDEARASIKTLRESFGIDLDGVRAEFLRWGHPEDFVEHILDGLRKAGMDDDAGSQQSSGVPVSSRPTDDPPQQGGAVDSKSIAVLPFVNQSADSENEYFSDGLTEELISDLAGIKALSVISRTSAMLFKGTAKDLPTIGRELGVRYVLEGSVRKAGSNLRITAQLVDAEKDTSLWSEKFSGKPDDVFEVQERVSREIVNALDVTLTHEESQRLAERLIADPRAFELYLQARQELRRVGGEGTEKAKNLLAEAVKIEGETPPLKALAAWAKVSEIRSGLNRDQKPIEEAARDGQDLIRTIPEAAYGHALMCYVEYERGNHSAAIRHGRAALDRDPSDADALFFMGASYIAAGQNEQLWKTSRQILACDPLGAMSWMLSGASRWFVGRFREALPDFHRALELDPENFFLQWSTGYTCVAIGELEDAARHAAVARKTMPDAPYTRQLLALIDATAGDKEAALDHVASIDFAPLDAHNKFHLAESLAMAGDHDRALTVLELAVDQGFYPYPFMSEHCPFLVALRSLREFEPILAKSKMKTESFHEDGPLQPSPPDASGEAT